MSFGADSKEGGKEGLEKVGKEAGCEDAAVSREIREVEIGLNDFQGQRHRGSELWIRTKRKQKVRCLPRVALI